LFWIESKQSYIKLEKKEQQIMKENVTHLLRRPLTVLLVSVMLLAGVVAAAGFESVAAQADSVREGINYTGDEISQDQAKNSIENIIETTINLFSLVVGVIAVIMIIIGGLKYIMSSGDASNVTSAKNTILYAIIGLVIVAFAQIIVLFVLDTTT
jgi:hypothetical protein